MTDQVTTEADTKKKDVEPDAAAVVAKKEPGEENLRGELERRREAQRKAESELDELRSKILEFEDRDKSELQRAQERATRAETQLQQLSGKVTSLEKGAWVRSAAAEFNFYDPEDAVVNLTEELAKFEDQRDARRAVERLAKAKQHLTRQDKKDNRPSIGQVLSNGQSQQPAAPAQGQTVEAQAAQRDLDFAQGLARELGEFRSRWTSFGGS